ncbi:MAG: hypothetical protein KGO05_15385 [Chloroflexota bacterium]|nr:hypothetical protein [Chloroflexota bacterium]
MSRRLIGYLLIAASLIAGVYLVFVLFSQWLGDGTTGQLLLDGAGLVGAFIVFCAGYYLITAIQR